MSNNAASAIDISMSVFKLKINFTAQLPITQTLHEFTQP